MTDWNLANISRLDGTTAIVTGANSGIGLVTAEVLASKGALVVMACRNLDKGEAAANKIRATHSSAKVDVAQLDVSSQASVNRFVDSFVEETDTLDLLINNAGIMAVPWSLTEDGVESQLATNHLGHFTLTNALLPLLEASNAGRVVSVASLAHQGGQFDFDNMTLETGYSPMGAYRRSKLANLLFTYELARRLERDGSKVIAVAAHPGITNTNLATETSKPIWYRALRPVVGLFLQGSAAGALPTLRAATDPGVVSGEYYGPKRFNEAAGPPVKVQSDGVSHDPMLAEMLWDWSQEMANRSR